MAVREIVYKPWYEIDRDETEGTNLFYAAIGLDVVGSLVLSYILYQLSFVKSIAQKERRKFVSDLIQLITLIVYFTLASGYFPRVGVEFLCGILIGYEIYGTIGELLAVHGRVRPEFLGHHAGCVFIGVLSYVTFYKIPLVERQFWWFAYDSMTLFFMSNAVMLVRNMQKKKTLFWNASFAVVFFWCRFVLQYRSIFKFQELFGVSMMAGKGLPWKYWSTTVLYAMWSGFTCLNIYWGVLILRMAFCKRKNKGRKGQ